MNTITVILISIVLFLTLSSIYTVSLIIKFVPFIIIILAILYSVGAFKEEYFEVNITPTSEYDQATCYTNGNRPFVIDPQNGTPFSGTTMHCIMKGGPSSWKNPSYNLPISDPKNPAFYNQYPLERSHFK